ncbi:hypothetical protein GQ54DRAFT_304487 [Martensiomyces pterosporus]|nr:hypothetical protein GQ54DRAFT_304487 [Martensiomyces pterosporus]
MSSNSSSNSDSSRKSDPGGQPSSSSSSSQFAYFAAEQGPSKHVAQGEPRARVRSENEPRSQHVACASMSSAEGPPRLAQVLNSEPLELMLARGHELKRTTAHAEVAATDGVRLPQWLSQNAQSRSPGADPIRTDAFVGYGENSSLAGSSSHTASNSALQALQPGSPADSGWQLVFEPPQQSPLMSSTALPNALAELSTVSHNASSLMPHNTERRIGVEYASAGSSDLDAQALSSLSSDSGPQELFSDIDGYLRTRDSSGSNHTHFGLPAEENGAFSACEDSPSMARTVRGKKTQHQSQPDSRHLQNTAIPARTADTCFNSDSLQTTSTAAQPLIGGGDNQAEQQQHQHQHQHQQQQDLKVLHDKVEALSAELLVLKKELKNADTQTSRITTALQCSICLETFSRPHSLGCGHVFCEECLLQWLRQSKKCPSCRADVRECPAMSFVIQDVIDSIKPGSSALGRNDSNNSPWQQLFPGQASSSEILEFVRCSECESWMFSDGHCIYCDPRRRRLDSYQIGLIGRMNELVPRLGRSQGGILRATPPQDDSSQQDLLGRDPATSPRSRLRRGRHIIRRINRRSLPQSPPESLFDITDLIEGTRARQLPIQWLPPQDAPNSSEVRQDLPRIGSTAERLSEYQWEDPSDWYHASTHRYDVGVSGAFTRARGALGEASGATRTTRLRRTNNRTSAPNTGTLSRNPIRISRIMGQGGDTTNAVASRAPPSPSVTISATQGSQFRSGMYQNTRHQRTNDPFRVEPVQASAVSMLDVNTESHSAMRSAEYGSDRVFSFLRSTSRDQPSDSDDMYLESDLDQLRDTSFRYMPADLPPPSPPAATGDADQDDLIEMEREFEEIEASFGRTTSQYNQSRDLF